MLKDQTKSDLIEVTKMNKPGQPNLSKAQQSSDETILREAILVLRRLAKSSERRILESPNSFNYLSIQQQVTENREAYTFALRVLDKAANDIKLDKTISIEEEE